MAIVICGMWRWAGGRPKANTSHINGGWGGPRTHRRCSRHRSWSQGYQTALSMTWPGNRSVSQLVAGLLPHGVPCDGPIALHTHRHTHATKENFVCNDTKDKFV